MTHIYLNIYHSIDKTSFETDVPLAARSKRSAVQLIYDMIGKNGGMRARGLSSSASEVSLRHQSTLLESSSPVVPRLVALTILVAASWA